MNSAIRYIHIILAIGLMPISAFGQMNPAVEQSTDLTDDRSVVTTIDLTLDLEHMAFEDSIKEAHHHFDRNHWQIISKSQSTLELFIPGVDLTGSICNWWSSDTATMKTINGIFVKEMAQSSFTNHDPWTNYYDFLPGQFACGVCVTDSGLTDTFMIKMEPLGACKDRKYIYRSGNSIVIEFDNDFNQWTNVSAFYGTGIQILAHPFNAGFNLSPPIVLPVSSFPAWVSITRVCVGGYLDRETVIVW